MLGRYTTGPVAARPDYSRGDRPCQRPALYSATDAGPTDRPPQRHRFAAHRRHAPGDGRGRGRRRRLRRRPDRHRPRGTCRGAARQGGRAVRRERDDGQSRVDDGPPRRAARRSSPAREHHLVIDEAAGHAVIVGASARSLEDRPDGTLDPAAIDAAFRDPTDRPRAAVRPRHAREHPCPLDGPAR